MQFTPIAVASPAVETHAVVAVNEQESRDAIIDRPVEKSVPGRPTSNCARLIIGASLNL